MKNEIKIGIVGVDHLCGNRGVGALAVSLFYLLNKISKETNKEIEITNINNNYGKYTIDINNESIEIVCISSFNFFNIKDFLKFLIMPRQIPSLIKYLKLDCILSMGGGDSFSDIYGKRRFATINAEHKMARLLKKQYLLLPQTIGPFNDTNVKKAANKSIEKAKCVFARDMQSFNYVAKSTKQENVFEAIDVAFFMPFNKQEFSTENINVGLNISALLWHGGYTQNNQFGLKKNYKELIHNIIALFLDLPKVKIHIVPHVVHDRSHIENDYEISYQLVHKYNNDRIILAPFFLTPIIAKNYIAGLDFFIGARMHATIAAFSSGVPVYPLSYSRKFNGLFKDTLNYKYMGDMVNDESESIIEGIKDAFDNRNKLVNIIQSRLNTIVKEREKLLLDKLKKFVGL